MSKTLAKIGMVVGAIALVATGVGAFAVAGSALAATAGTIATYAGLAAGVANLGAALTQKKPPARGSVSQILIQADAPQPYVMGEGYFAGVLRHDAGYGATLKKVPNPYRAMVVVYSGGGPIESITPQVDFAAVTSWYNTFLYTSTALGACPESAALAPHFAGLPGWGASSKLSGQAAILWNFLFDKDGKRFAGGLPVLGAYGQWVRAYDPRLDDTYPGGSGDHRVDDESTWEWSENPGLHGLTYALGRHQNGKFTLGMDLPPDSIAIEDFVEHANVCDANSWRMFGVVYEPGDREVRWNNLKDIVGAGAAEPYIANGKLRLRIQTPKVALDTITEDDLAEGRREVTAMRPLADRINSIVPKYRSADNNWELVDADAVTVSEYVTEDGEEIERSIPYNFVKDVDQAAQLAAYDLVDGRELGPIVLNCKPRLRGYRPGDCLSVVLPRLGLNTDAIIATRKIDPATMTVAITFMGETPAKHDYALGITGTPPPTPALGQTPQERDELAAAATAAPSAAHRLISYDPLYPLSGTDTTIPVIAFDGVTDDGRTIAFPADTVTGLTASTAYNVFWDGAAYSAAAAPATAEMADSDLIFIGFQATDDGAGTYPGGTPPPPGWGGSSGGYEP